MKLILAFTMLLLAGLSSAGEQHGGGFSSAVDHARLMSYIYTIQIPVEDYQILEKRLSTEEEAFVPRTELLARKINQDIVVYSQELGELRVIPKTALNLEKILK